MKSACGTNQDFVAQMAWELRSNSKQYLYRSVRDAEGRVRKQYFGNGERAQAALAEFEAQRKAKQAHRLELEGLKDEQREMEQRFIEINRVTNQLVADVLLRGGWHNPKSRGLRRRRIAK